MITMLKTSATTKLIIVIMLDQYSFINKDAKLLEVLSLLFAGAILPFIYYFGNTVNNKDFNKFVQYSTTNCNIFYDFARYMAKNYIFCETIYSKNSKKSKDKNFAYSKQEFANLLEENYSSIFESKIIRKRFIEFVNKHQARALSEVTLKKEAPKKAPSYNEPSVNLTVDKNGPNKKIEEEADNDSSNIPLGFKAARIAQLKQKSNKYSVIEAARSDFKDSYRSLHNSSSGNLKKFKEDVDEELNAKQESNNNRLMPGSKDKDMNKYRMDDTINISRNPNLSVEDDTNKFDIEQNNFKFEITNHFGSKLIEFFQNEIVNRPKNYYKCNNKTCKLTYLKEYNFDDNLDLSGMDDKILKPRLSHSFRYSVSHQMQEGNDAGISAQDYLKDIVKSNISMKDFIDFYYGDYYKEGILNGYIRLLDVYSEFILSGYLNRLSNNFNPKIKIFETNILDEIQNEKYSGVISEELDGEFEDFFSYDVLIIPIFK